MTEILYSPWKMKDVRRLYVNTVDGESLGYLDLATLEVVPVSADSADPLRSAIQALGSPGAGTATPPTAAVPPAAKPAPQVRAHGWEDLADTPPAYRLAGLEDASYRTGAAAEQRTAGVLATLERSGHHVLHSLPLSPRKDIDHLVIGLSGVYAINTKSSTYEVVVREDGHILADGYKQGWLDSAVRDAEVAGGYLSTAARMEIECTPIVAVWSTVGLTTAHRRVVDAAEIAERIRSRPARFSPAWVDVVYANARRSDTWTAHH